MLIECPSCGRQISDAAESCPQCGHPREHPDVAYDDKPETSSISLTISLIAFILAIFTPRFLLFFPLMISFGFAAASLFRKEKWRLGSVIIIILAIGLFISSNRGPTPSFKESTSSQHLHDAEITKWNWHKDPGFGTNGTIKWNIQVKNKSSYNIRNVKVEFTTYDKNGNLVTSEFTYVNAIPPGQFRTKESYAALYGTEDHATIQISDVLIE
jgi:energy-coupling factor transporter transmembrane protein EcfT